ncbi:MAG: hypothetical protein U0872_12185 [Planctomycetaceae bacterium]
MPCRPICSNKAERSASSPAIRKAPSPMGSLLGDRCRITSTGSSEQVFLREDLSTSSGRRGVAERLDVMLTAMQSFGFDWVLMETVGAGQGDTAVRAWPTCWS